MSSAKESHPNVFKGFAVDKIENWDKPKLVEYEAKRMNPTEVCVKIECCAICGSDVHTLKGSWGPLRRKDLVVGHEIIGHIVSVGDKVTEFNIGDRVGIGPCCKACGKCVRCKSDNEQYCHKLVGSYNVPDWEADGYITQGGYADYKIADEKFTFPIPEALDSKHAAPMMCGGLTVFSPLVRSVGYDATGKTVGVIGIGGLGHMAVQFASALGAQVVAFSRSSAKRKQCFEMGANHFIATQENENWYDTYSDTFDLILNCASSFSEVDFSAFSKALKVGALLISVGAPPITEKITFNPLDIIYNNFKLSGSCIGSKKEAIKMLEIAVAKGVRPWIEEVPITAESCGTSLLKCAEGKVRYRFVFTKFDEIF